MVSDFEFIRQRLPDPSHKAELELIARGSGVPYHTLLKIANGVTADPRTSTVNRLVIYFRARASRKRGEARAA
jgi:predicted transcriptional regulator